jgi:hypothetical protein
MDNAGELGKIRDRLSRFERQNARLRTAGVFLLVAVVAGFVLASKWGRWRSEIATERFVIKDRHGVTRGSLGVERGMPILMLMDDEGLEVASLRGYSDGTSTLVLSSRGMPRIAMNASTYGPSLNLTDPNHSPTEAALCLTPNGTPELVLRGESRSMDVGVAKDGSAGFRFEDREGHSLGRLEAKTQGPTELRVLDGAGKVVSRSPLRDGNAPKRHASGTTQS